MVLKGEDIWHGTPHNIDDAREPFLSRFSPVDGFSNESLRGIARNLLR